MLLLLDRWCLGLVELHLVNRLLLGLLSVLLGLFVLDVAVFCLGLFGFPLLHHLFCRDRLFFLDHILADLLVLLLGLDVGGPHGCVAGVPLALLGVSRRLLDDGVVFVSGALFLLALGLLLGGRKTGGDHGPVGFVESGGQHVEGDQTRTELSVAVWQKKCDACRDGGEVGVPGPMGDFLGAWQAAGVGRVQAWDGRARLNFTSFQPSKRSSQLLISNFHAGILC